MLSTEYIESIAVSNLKMFKLFQKK